MPSKPVRVALVNDYEIVVVGTAGVLAPFAERVVVVEIDSRSEVVNDVDVVLYDSFGQVQGPDVDIDSLTASSVDAKVVVFSWNTDPELVEGALEQGAHGYISKGVSAEELVTLIERAAAGETITPQRDEQPDGDDFGRWPGADWGLSPREAEVLALICQGFSNQDITERAFLGINTVKTYIRSLYRKIDVDSRTRAVLWGIDHGFRPDQVRHVRQD